MFREIRLKDRAVNDEKAVEIYSSKDYRVSPFALNDKIYINGYPLHYNL